MEITQCELLLKELKQGRKLTGVEIINELFILNYKGRIFDLRKKGHLINTIMVKTKKAPDGTAGSLYYQWSGRQDLNLRPLVPQTCSPVFSCLNSLYSRVAYSTQYPILSYQKFKPATKSATKNIDSGVYVVYK